VLDTSNEFTVRFGKHARTLNYDDPHDHFLFTFDIGSKGNKSLCLEHHAPQAPRRPRYGIAFERTKKYLESCGYEVEIYGK
jgi:hypothetical protein